MNDEESVEVWIAGIWKVESLEIDGKSIPISELWFIQDGELAVTTGDDEFTVAISFESNDSLHIDDEELGSGKVVQHTDAGFEIEFVDQGRRYKLSRIEDDGRFLMDVYDDVFLGTTRKKAKSWWSPETYQAGADLFCELNDKIIPT